MLVLHVICRNKFSFSVAVIQCVAMVTVRIIQIEYLVKNDTKYWICNTCLTKNSSNQRKKNENIEFLFCSDKVK